MQVRLNGSTEFDSRTGTIRNTNHKLKEELNYGKRNNC